MPSTLTFCVKTIVLKATTFGPNFFVGRQQNFAGNICLFFVFESEMIKMESWTNFKWQDTPWAEFSTLEVAACHAMHLLRSIAIWPNLELKTQPKQLLGCLPLDIALPDAVHSVDCLLSINGGPFVSCSFC